MYQYQAEVKRIVDGDTMDLIIDLGFKIHSTIRVRLGNFDAPETFRPSCDAEKQHANECAVFIKEHMPEGSHVTVKTTKTGKYGRWIADIKVKGCDLVELLTINGFQKKDSYL